MRDLPFRPGFSRCLVLLAAGGLSLWSQSNAVGSLAGSVKGPGGRAVAGALVRIDTGRGIRETRTNDKGQFLMPLLLPGTVQVSVHAEGMEAFKSKASVIVNQTTTLNIPLRPQAGTTVEVVTVMAPSVGTDRNVAVSGSSFTVEQIQSLPYIGSIQNAFLKSMPGTPSGGFNFHGSEDGVNNFIVDGAEVRAASGGMQTLGVNPDMIEQFSALSSGVSAEYGRFVGAVVTTVSKSGTNEFHGSMRHDLTSKAWNALPHGTKMTDVIHYPRHVQDQQSYTFLGPILKDHLFFALSYQVLTPSAFSSVVGRPGSGLFDPFRFTSEGKSEAKEIKLDWQINTDHRLSAGYNDQTSSSTNGTYGLGRTSFATTSGSSDNDRKFVTLGYTGVLSSSLLLDVKASQMKTDASSAGSPGGTDIVTWKDTKGSGNGDLYDNGTVTPRSTTEKVQTLGANLTWVAGSHQLKGGFQYYKSEAESMGSMADSTGGWAAMTPSRKLIKFYGWSDAPASMAIANRVLRVDNSGSTLTLFDPLQGRVDLEVSGLYANDVWTLNPHWSFNLGFRYDHYRYLGKPEGNTFSSDAFVPRLSASYDLKGDGKHVFGASAAEYAGLTDTGSISPASVTSQVPVRIYRYYGPAAAAGAGNGANALNADGSINWAVWGKSATALGEANPYLASPNPLANRTVTVDRNLKPPRARELTLSYRYTDARQSLAATLLQKRQDQYVDNRYLGVLGTPAGQAKQLLTNDDGAETRYSALELQYRRQLLESLSVGGNLTWSSTRANAGQGYGSSSPRNNFGGLIANDLVAPYGPQSGQWSSSSTPFTAHMDATYSLSLGAFGTVRAGLLGNYWSRSFNGFRSFTGDTDPSVQAYGYPAQVTRYYTSERLWWPEQYGFDLHLGYEVSLYRRVLAFASLDVLNLFNHLQPMYVYHSTALKDVTTGTIYQPYAGGLPAGWYTNPNLKPIAADGWMKDGEVGAYTNPRSIQLRLGLRF